MLYKRHGISQQVRKNKQTNKQKIKQTNKQTNKKKSKPILELIILLQKLKVFKFEIFC